MADVLLCDAMGWTERQLYEDNSPEFIADLRVLLTKRAIVSRRKAAAGAGS